MLGKSLGVTCPSKAEAEPQHGGVEEVGTLSTGVSGDKSQRSLGGTLCLPGAENTVLLCLPAITCYLTLCAYK